MDTAATFHEHVFVSVDHDLRDLRVGKKLLERAETPHTVGDLLRDLGLLVSGQRCLFFV
jgi:hypothetical protein